MEIHLSRSETYFSSISFKVLRLTAGKMNIIASCFGCGHQDLT